MRTLPGSAGFGSVWSMTPDNPALQALASIPVSPKVAAHSIIAVEGDGPIETGDDLIEWVNVSEGTGLGMAQRKR